MINPTLSIIIVSYNTSTLTLNCLKSILLDKGLDLNFQKSPKATDKTSNKKDSPKTPTEIIIIDNNSKDSSVKDLQKFIKDKKLDKTIKLIANKDNLGFAKANNQGIALSTGEYLLLLNSDTLILHSAISQSLDWLCSHPEAAACTAQLLNQDKTIQASGGFFPNLLNTFTWSTGLDDLPFINSLIKPIHPHTPNFYTKDSFYLSDHQQDWVTGAFMMLRRSVINPKQTFDPHYFMYGEELELSYRIKKQHPQLQTWYLIGPQIIHLGGASAESRLDPILNEYLGIHSFFKKHKPDYQAHLVRFLLKTNARLRAIIFTILRSPKASLYQTACSKL